MSIFSSVVIVQHLGYFFILVAVAIKDILWLRIVLGFAQFLLFCYAMVVDRQDIALWNFALVSVNVVNIISLLNQKKKVPIPKEFVDLYNKLFNEFTTKEFIYLLSLGHAHHIENKVLIREGTKQKDLVLILSGTALVKHHEQIISQLERGSFVGEISLVTEEPANADVETSDYLEYIAWDQDELRALKEKNFMIWTKLHDVITRDLSRKITNMDNSITKK